MSDAAQNFTPAPADSIARGNDPQKFGIFTQQEELMGALHRALCNVRTAQRRRSYAYMEHASLWEDVSLAADAISEFAYERQNEAERAARVEANV